LIFSIEALTEPMMIRVAMWSGPRNISTAMMRSWENRPDTVVCDEPLYAHFLRQTGANHPVADQIIDQHEDDLDKVIHWLTQWDPGDGTAVFYQKHMTHHFLPEMPRDWLAGLTNCFLIRDPAEVIPSYVKKNGVPTVPDLGFEQQVELFEFARAQTGRVPPVIDSKDVLENPKRVLGLLCEALGIAFDERMLSWPAGKRPTDGVWADHWYTEVVKSTSFGPYKPKNEPVPDDLAEVHDRCRALYEQMHAHRLC
jgi:hypothetical protein